MSRESTPQDVAPAYCDMVVDYLCNEHGERGDEILCGKPAILAGESVVYCLDHALETAAEGLDMFTKDDARAWTRLAAACAKHGVPTTPQPVPETPMLRRGLLVFDGTKWFVRSVSLITHDLDSDEKVYHCDQPIGSSYVDPQEALAELLKYLGR